MAITIIIDETEYTAVKNPQFAPQVDLVGNSLPINEFQIDIVTDDAISAGQPAEFRWNGALWARYWVDYAERTDENTVHIRARSEIALLDGVTLEAKMYTGESLEDVLDEVMVRQSGASGIVAVIDYTLDNALTSATVTGFCPQQTARERLQWVCFACGAYVKTAFVDKITVLPIDATAALIPLESTFWRPAVEHGEYVTAIKLTAYTFTQSASAASDNSSYTFPLPWVASTQEYTLDNQNVPSTINDNVYEISELYLINQSNVSALLSLLASVYFKRTIVQLDALDNGDYVPGDKVYAYAEADAIYTGFVKSASFKFGRQARATLNLTASLSVDVDELTIRYTNNNTVIETESIYLPVGYAYSVTTRYIDKIINGHRYVYRPQEESVSGTMASGGVTATVACDVVLDLYEDVLYIIGVDEVTLGGGDYDTAVIA